jgi:hypothetical protein
MVSVLSDGMKAALLNLEEEAAFLASFTEASEQIHLTTVQEIPWALEAKDGTAMAPSPMFQVKQLWGYLGSNHYW